MHEHGLADRILETVLRHPDRPPHAHPTAVTVQVSELGGPSAEALQGHLDHVCEHLNIPPVALRVEVVPLLGARQGCGTVAPIDEGLTCASCGSTNVRICGGETAVLRTCEYVSDPLGATGTC